MSLSLTGRGEVNRKADSSDGGEVAATGNARLRYDSAQCCRYCIQFESCIFALLDVTACRVSEGLRYVDNNSRALSTSDVEQTYQ
jgi:hypothetical protein